MAIEVKTFPGPFHSVHDDLLFVVHEATKTADPVTYPDYRYLADVYAESEFVGRLKAYPHPTTGMGVFDLSGILRNYITPALNPNLSTFEVQELNQGDWNVSGSVFFGEEYDFVQYHATIPVVGNKFYGHYNGRLIGDTTNLTSVANSYASNRPRRFSIYRETANCFIPFHKVVDIADPVDVTITMYDVNNNSLGSTSFSLASTNGFGSLRIFNVGIDGINTTALTVTDSVAYYTIDADGEVITVDLVCEPKYTSYTVHFLNKYGGFESKDFTKVSRKLLEIEKKDFGKLPYTVNASGVVAYYNSNNVYNETRSVYSSQYKEKMTLNTDVLTDAEYTWLGDLILSPMAFIEIEGYFIPTVIVSNNYEFKKTINDKVTNLTMEIEFGERFNTQYR